MGRLIRVALATSVAACALLPGTAQAEPISLALASAITGSLISAAAAKVIASIVVAVALAAIGTVVSTIFAPKPPSPPTPADGQAPLQQPIPETLHAIGRNRMAGSYMLHEATNGDLHQAMAILDGFFSRVIACFLNDDRVTIDANGYVQAGEGGRYRNNTVRLMWHDGSPMPSTTPAADNPLRPLIQALPGALTNAFRPDKTAALGTIYKGVSANDFGSVYPNGVPQPSVAGETTRLFDPRDPDQSASDPSTWRYSANAALARIFYECFSEHGPGKDYATAILPRLDLWKRQADICDEMVETYEGDYVRRYEYNFWWKSSTSRADIRGSILASCDGWDSHFGDGSFIMRVGRYHAPLVTLTDDDIVGFRIQAGGPGSADYVNELFCKFTDPDHDFGEADVAAWRDDAEMVIYGRNSVTIELWPVQTRSQARRLGKRIFNRSRARLSGTLYTNLRSMVIAGDRYVRIRSERIAMLADVVIEVGRQRTSLKEMRREIDFRVINPNELDSWSPEEEGPPPPEIGKVDNSPPPAPENVAGVATYDYNGGVPSARLAISWDETGRADLQWFVQFRRFGEDFAEEMFVTDPLIEGGRVYATTGIVLADNTYEIIVRASGVGGTSAYSTPISVSTSTEAVAPAEPTNLSVEGGSGEAILQWRAPETVNFYTARVYRVEAGEPFVDATLIATDLPGAIAAPMTYTDTTVGPGSWDYFVTAANLYGAASTPAGPVTATVST